MKLLLPLLRLRPLPKVQKPLLLKVEKRKDNSSHFPFINANT
jgi:hypothetical protein